ncbi:hypothetical protein RCL_jg13673.t1 [Rhizophagus clarus]|uniref:Uncharacterized protein n=1 Tax=Rhizophagus clarus TaxID=94130 RepID=A0A8H3MDM2_9GLOM|nr:hypothetical protein RCL_jg13673.t1 [Rhizophagus clarus]
MFVNCQLVLKESVKLWNRTRRDLFGLGSRRLDCKQENRLEEVSEELSKGTIEEANGEAIKKNNLQNNI